MLNERASPTKEIWKSITGYDGLYEISNLGNVKSWYKGKAKMLKQSNTTTGYKKVTLYKDGQRKHYKVHRLVAIHFVPNLKQYRVINHIDGNKHNNKAYNLEWCTYSENTLHAYATGLKKSVCITKSKLQQLYVNENKTIYDIATIYNTTPTTIWRKLKEFNIHTRKTSEYHNKYNISLSMLLKDFRYGKRNIELAKKYQCTTSIIATRRNQFKKRGLLNA